ncbi:MAG: hypothetical protein IJE73_08450 [Muribaculaceae bacterium]|nr:hypothetical protein [Muribaculaceae bacterium]
MEERLIYEHLVCKAFKCCRADVYFADADVYDALINSVKEDLLKEYVLIALKLLIIYGDFVGEQLRYLEDVFNNLYIGTHSIDETLKSIQLYV